MAKELGYWSSKLQRYRHDINMQSPNKSDNPKKTEKDLKWPQKTSKGFPYRSGLYHFSVSK